MATTAQFPGGVESLVLSCRDATALLVGGVLTLHWTDGRVEVHGAEVASGSGAGVMDFPYIWHRAQIAEFVDAVRAGRAPASNGQNALAVQRLIEAMVQSSAHGQRETV